MMGLNYCLYRHLRHAKIGMPAYRRRFVQDSDMKSLENESRETPENVPVLKVDRRGKSPGSAKGRRVGRQPAQNELPPDAPEKEQKATEPDVSVMRRMKAGEKARSVQEKVWAKLFERDPIRFNAELERLEKQARP